MRPVFPPKHDLNDCQGVMLIEEDEEMHLRLEWQLVRTQVEELFQRHYSNSSSKIYQIVVHKLDIFRSYSTYLCFSAIVLL